MLLTSVLLGLAIGAVWLPDMRLGASWKVPPWTMVLAIATAVGLANGVLDWRGAVVVVVLCGMAFAASRTDSVALKRGLTIAAVVLSFALGINQVPGFQPSVFLQGIKVSPDAPPMRLTAHFAPGLAGLVLVAFYAHRARTFGELQAAMPRTLAIAGAATVVVIGAAWAIGYVRPDWKLPDFTAAHLAKILLWTTVLEEGLFRGVIQGGLARLRLVRERPHLSWLPIAAASLLFGLAHAPGGWTYVALATLAGVGYGVAYARTGLIEAAMLTHFAVNATHFIAFTYPHIVRE